MHRREIRVEVKVADDAQLQATLDAIEAALSGVEHSGLSISPAVLLDPMQTSFAI